MGAVLGVAPNTRPSRNHSLQHALGLGRVVVAGLFASSPLPPQPTAEAARAGNAGFPLQSLTRTSYRASGLDWVSYPRRVKSGSASDVGFFYRSVSSPTDEIFSPRRVSASGLYEKSRCARTLASTAGQRGWPQNWLSVTNAVASVANRKAMSDRLFREAVNSKRRVRTAESARRQALRGLKTDKSAAH